MSIANLITLVVAILGPFVLVLSLDLVLTLASRRDFNEHAFDEKGRAGRD
jgi:hypothetical protein